MDPMNNDNQTQTPPATGDMPMTPPAPTGTEPMGETPGAETPMTPPAGETPEMPADENNGNTGMGGEPTA